MTSGTPDLSVVCPSCAERVSPYITECPYCGKRVRKRAPKLGSREDPANKAAKREKRRRRAPARPKFNTSSGRLLVVPGLLIGAVTLTILVRSHAIQVATLVLVGPISNDWPKLVSSPFVHLNLAYAFMVLVPFAIFGSVIERSLSAGPFVVLGTWLLAGAGGAWLSAGTGISIASGALAPAIAMTFACGMAALDARRGGDHDVDIVGPGVALVALCLLPALVIGATWQELVSGLVVGIGVGSLLTVRLRSA